MKKDSSPLDKCANCKHSRASHDGACQAFWCVSCMEFKEAVEGLNQCDGCRAGIPLENGKYHRMGKPGGYVDLMVCEKDKYEGQHD